MSLIVRTSTETAIQPLSVESTLVTSAMDDLFRSLLASRAHFLTTLTASNELTQERFREQSIQLAELISDLGNIHRQLIAERERNQGLKTGYETEVRSYVEVIRDISTKVAAINQGVATLLQARETTEPITAIVSVLVESSTPSDEIRRELAHLAAVVDTLAQGFIKISTKIDKEAVKLTAATSEVEILKAQLAAAKLQNQNLRASHAAQVASLSASTEARIKAEDESWSHCYHAYQRTYLYYHRKYAFFENKEDLAKKGILTKDV